MFRLKRATFPGKIVDSLKEIVGSAVQGDVVGRGFSAKGEGPSVMIIKKGF